MIRTRRSVRRFHLVPETVRTLVSAELHRARAGLAGPDLTVVKASAHCGSETTPVTISHDCEIG